MFSGVTYSALFENKIEFIEARVTLKQKTKARVMYSFLCDFFALRRFRTIFGKLPLPFYQESHI